MLEIPRIERTLDLGECDPSYTGLHLQVWVNVSRRHRTAYAGVFRQFAEAVETKDLEAMSRVGPTLAAWWSEVWGVSADEALRFYNDASTDLWDWVVRESFALIEAYRLETAGPKVSTG
jgi:hypothetical protein